MLFHVQFYSLRYDIFIHKKNLWATYTFPPFYECADSEVHKLPMLTQLGSESCSDSNLSLRTSFSLPLTPCCPCLQMWTWGAWSLWHAANSQREQRLAPLIFVPADFHDCLGYRNADKRHLQSTRSKLSGPPQRVSMRSIGMECLLEHKEVIAKTAREVQRSTPKNAQGFR